MTKVLDQLLDCGLAVTFFLQFGISPLLVDLLFPEEGIDPGLDLSLRNQNANLFSAFTVLQTLSIKFLIQLAVPVLYLVFVRINCCYQSNVDTGIPPTILLDLFWIVIAYILVGCSSIIWKTAIYSDTVFRKS